MPKVLRDFCWLVVFLSVVSVAYCLVEHFVLRHPYPWDWPFFFPEVRFNDFTLYVDKYKQFHQAAFFNIGDPFTYPAPVALVYWIFYKAPNGHSLSLFLGFMVVAFVVPLILFARALRSRGLTIGATIALVACLMLSWPAMLLIDRANMEIVVWVVLVLATWAYATGRFWMAAAFFGVAASMKLFPFVYLGLFLTRTRYRQMLFGVLVFGLVSVVSLAFVGPTIAFANHAIQQGLNFFRDVYMGHFISSVGGVDHSPLAFLKLIAAVMTHSLYAPYGTPELSRITHIMLKIYLPLTAIAGLVLYFLRIRKLPWLNQLLVLSIVSIYFTAFSGDGTLVHLYYAFALCCFLAMDASKKGRNIPGLRVMFLCFAYLFSVESFWIYHGLRFEGQAKCIVIGILLLVALFFPIGPLPSDENEMLLLVDQDSGQVPAIASRKTSGLANG